MQLDGESRLQAFHSVLGIKTASLGLIFFELYVTAKKAKVKPKYQHCIILYVVSQSYDTT